MLNPLSRGDRRLFATLFLTASLSIVGCTDDNGATSSSGADPRNHRHR